MILSTIKGESGYAQFCELAKKKTFAQVLLNGVIVENCIYADDVRGIVRVYEKDSDGSFLMDMHGDILVKELAGKVEILLEPRMVDSNG